MSVAVDPAELVVLATRAATAAGAVLLRAQHDLSLRAYEVLLGMGGDDLPVLGAPPSEL